MTDREKLAEIVEMAAHRCLPSNTEDFHLNMFVRDLLANGVTVQRWIPVTERLPEEGGYYMVAHQRSGCVAERFYYRDCPDLFVEVTGDPVTHWMPLPEPPNEVEWMTCKDCLHFDVCDQSSRMMWAAMEGKTECDDFADRSRYVEREKGEWVELTGRALCPVCADECWADSAATYNFCPNCGADMRGAKSE